MKAKYFAVLLPMGMSIFPGLLASQDANRGNSFYEKEFGLGEGAPKGTNGPAQERKNQGTPANTRTTTKKDSASKNSDPSTVQEATTGSDRSNSTTKELRERLRQLNQQYQEELQTLMDGNTGSPRSKTPEIPGQTSETRTWSFQENSRADQPPIKKSPKPLDPDFQVQDWPKLPISKEASYSNNSPDFDGFTTASGQRRNQEKGRTVYPADYVSPNDLPVGNGTVQRANGTQSSLRGDDNLVQTQGNYYQGNGYPSNQQPRQVIRTQPAVPTYADNGQGNPRRSTTNPIQNNGESARNRQVQNNNAPDPFQKEMEILKSRYLEDLRNLNQRYQEEAAYLVTGQPVIRPVGTANRNGANASSAGQPPQRGNGIVGNDPLIKPSKTVESSWFPRMFSYFKPTLPFARVSPGTSSGETRMAQVEPRNGAPSSQPVKQTSYFPSLAQPDTKKNGQGRPNNRPNTQGQIQQGEYQPGDYAPPQRDQGYPNQNNSRGQVNENYYPPQGNNRQGNPGNSQDNRYPNRPVNQGYNQPTPRGPYSGNYPAGESNYRPDPRMVPVQNQNYSGGEEYPVRPANSPSNAPRGYSGNDEPERMPPGVPLQMGEKEKLRQAIEQLQRKYQDDLKSLLNSPPPPQEPEDEVYLPPDNGGRNTPPAKAVRTVGNGPNPQPGWAQQRQRSAEEFLEFLQANSQGIPNWATESDIQKPNSNKKAPSKDGVAQTNPDRKNGSRQNTRPEPIDEDPDQNP